MSITQETRRESYQKLNTSERKNLIMKTLSTSPDGMTAHEIATELGFSDLNKARPRLTELEGVNLIKVIGKRYDSVTNVNVAVYKVVQ